MTLRLLILASLVGGLDSVSAAANGPIRPNIVFVLVDDLRWDDLGCAGHPFSRTPQMDCVPPLGQNAGSSDTVIFNRLRMLAAVDEGVGDILQALSDARQLDNTLVVVTGDHGYFYGEHCLSIERRLAYEESIRIPIVMRYPPLIAAGSTPDSIALTIDFAPTFLEVAGRAIPMEYQGRSLVPLFKGGVPPNWRDSFLVEYYSDTVFPRIRKKGYKAVRDGRWKYIHYTEQAGADELYDLTADPDELKNLIHDLDAAGALAKMKGCMERFLTETRKSN